MTDFDKLPTLEQDIIRAAAQVDGLTLAEWLAPMIARGEDLSVRARAVVGYPLAVDAQDVAAVQEAALKAEETREAKKIQEEESAAWAAREAKESGDT